jgi:signal transduction histidine kinase
MVTRLGEAQRQLTQADKLASVGRLAAGVAHEINNPLTGVLTYASFLQKRLTDRPEAVQDLDVIVRETKRCREIVRGLLDFSRQTPPRRQATDLNDVVRRGVAVIMNQLTLARVSLDFALAETLRPIAADANQIQQVVVNLVLNAADAIGDEGGTIRMRTREVDRPARGHEVIRSAKCPKGCDLIDPGVRIGRFPAIRVLRRVADHDTIVHLDPVYGRVNHRATEPCEAGVTGAYACPRCRTHLELPDRECAECGAHVFSVVAGERGRVEWCTRKGCHWTRWEAADALGSQPFVELVVHDTGHGIAPEDLDHLFEPFFTTKGNRGLGLGLAVTWGIVEGHGGTIDVQSEPGDGACFTVSLPCAGSAAEPAPATAPATTAPAVPRAVPRPAVAPGGGPA